MTHILTLLLSLAGFSLLFVAMPRHQQEWLRRKLGQATSRKLRRGGFALLALAFVTSGSRLGWTYGALSWCGWLTVSAFAGVIVNTNRQRILRPGARR